MRRITEEEATSLIDIYSQVEENKFTQCINSTTKHEGARYESYKCENKATCKSDLTKHKKVKHEGVKY